MLRSLLLTFALGLNAGCAYLGSKSVLGVDSGDGWTSRYGEYSFRGNEVIISIPEVVISKRASAMGPVLPILPSGSDTSFESKQLELRLTVMGFPNVTDTGPDAVVVTVHSAGNSITLLSKRASVVAKTTKNNEEGKLWVQYSIYFKYNADLGDLKQLSLHFQLPMFDEAVPELHLSRREENDNQFIVSPGP